MPLSSDNLKANGCKAFERMIAGDTMLLSASAFLSMALFLLVYIGVSAYGNRRIRDHEV